MNEVKEGGYVGEDLQDIGESQCHRLLRDTGNFHAHFLTLSYITSQALQLYTHSAKG